MMAYAADSPGSGSVETCRGTLLSTDDSRRVAAGASIGAVALATTERRYSTERRDTDRNMTRCT